jgi:hypothetical protein
MIAMFAVRMIMAAIVAGIFVIMVVMAAAAAIRAVSVAMRGWKRISAKSAQWHCA